MNAFGKIFENPANGTVGAPSPNGFVELALLGKDEWNAWRMANPSKRDVNTGGWIGNVRWYDPVTGQNIDFREKSIPTFEGFDFGDGADFTQRCFPTNALANFQSTLFGAEARFEGAQFGGGVSFKGARFGNAASLRVIHIYSGTTPHPELNSWANFDDMTVGSDATFVHWHLYWQRANEPVVPARFFNCEMGDRFEFSLNPGISSEVVFKHTKFGMGANFVARDARIRLNLLECYLKKMAKFEGAAFSSVFVVDTHFEGDCSFAGGSGGKEALGEASFARSTFSGNADFSNRIFSARTSFEGASFATVPHFHNSELHQDTRFDEDSFPRHATGNGTDSRAYRTLKLAMSKSQATNYEQFFFRKEMAEEQEEHKKDGRRLLWLLYSAYRFFSNFGASVLRPSLAYLAAIVTFAGIYALLAPGSEMLWMLSNTSLDLSRTGGWFSFSVVSSLPMSGLDDLGKGIINELLHTPKFVPSALFSVALVTHKILSVLFIFLIGLALRNHFKMK